MRVLRLIGRLLLLLAVLLVVVLVAAGIWAATHRDQARALRQAATIGGALSGVDRLESIAARLAQDTEPARREDAGAFPATLVAAGDGARHPAIVVLVPDGTTAVEERNLRDAQHAIAGAGLAAWTVRVPITDRALVDDAAERRLAAALDAIAAHPATADRAVSVVAFGPTASLTLAVAATSSDARDLRAVIAVQPLIDIGALVEHRAELSPELRARVGRALVEVVRQEVGPTSPLVASLLEVAVESDDPLSALQSIPPRAAGPRLAPMLAVLQSDSTAGFDAAWDQLPQAIRDTALRNSPITFADEVDARVLVVDTTDDPWLRAEAERLQEELDDARVVAIDASTAGRVDDELGVREALSVSAWWLRAAGS